jgi:biotin carboxyl carrier protein
MKKLRLSIDGKESVLQLDSSSGSLNYRFTGALVESGTASITPVQHGIVSVLLNGQSYTAHILPGKSELEVWIGNKRYTVRVSDLRDRPMSDAKLSLAGPFELHALMPGKVVKLLVDPGAKVKSGQSLIVVEAMKMQNEMKSPKDGVVTRIFAVAGAAVGAGERLMLIE